MAEKVTFDGDNKLIIINNGEDELVAERDIYSAWKRWKVEAKKDNAKWLQALRTVGGDPIGGTQTVSPYFFLLNGWKLRPYEATHRLIVDGNLFVDGGGSPFVATVGNFNVVVELQTSSKSITDTITVSAGSGLSQEEHDQLYAIPNEGVVADAVWDEVLAQHIASGSAGEIVTKIKKLVALIPAGL